VLCDVLVKRVGVVDEDEGSRRLLERVDDPNVRRQRLDQLEVLRIGGPDRCRGFDQKLLGNGLWTHRLSSLVIEGVV
jgi:hypothetical protein